jgi:hypothetical protein
MMVNRAKATLQAATRFSGLVARTTLMPGRGTLLRVIVRNAGGSSPNLVFSCFNANPLNPPFFEIDAAAVTTGAVIPIYRQYDNGLTLASLPNGSVIEVEVRGG